MKLLTLASAATVLGISSSFHVKGPVIRAIGHKLSASMSTEGKKHPFPDSVEGWKVKLSPIQFQVLRQQATEPGGYSENTPGELEFELKKDTGSKLPDRGTFTCVGCDAPLYTAAGKFDSGCGWPAFYEGVEGAITERPDSDGRRVEIVCTNCGSHLGHVFKNEGFPTPTDERHCVNGICLRYDPTS
jgi:peptide-methionine (R)-S-oxide reductase